ncbi:MAG: hypothetical protein MUC52_00900, partial [Candidatus Omnitrophica bacterium]|nr:hypothetical protein [Candidatus Omnitrophota bacterium]
ALAQKLVRTNPSLVIPEYSKKMQDLARQMAVRLAHILELKESRFAGVIEKMASLNPLNILSRGYSVTLLLPEGKIIKSASDAKAGGSIQTKLFKGELISRVTEVRTDG